MNRTGRIIGIVLMLILGVVLLYLAFQPPTFFLLLHGFVECIGCGIIGAFFILAGVMNTKNVEKAESRIKYFIFGIIIGFLVLFYGVISNSDFIIGNGIIVMGIVTVVLPFTTPETVALLGYQKSRIVGRILGILLIVVGIWVGFV